MVLVDKRAYAFHKWQLDLEKDDQLRGSGPGPRVDIYRKSTSRHGTGNKTSGSSGDEKQGAQRETMGAKGEEEVAKKVEQVEKK